MTKEKVQINQVDAPTLFVGVGGTGCDIVKRVAEMCRPGETENINFVCLDTNVNDLTSIAKSKSRIYYVQTSNTQTVGDYLSYDEDALKNWFPKNAVIYDKTVSEGAGQVRAISRLALNATIKTGQIRPMYDAIDDLFRKDGKEMKQALRVVFVSTSSGGTGSGIVLPLAMYIRDHISAKYPNTSLIVRSLILLPETLDSVIDSSVERDSQRRNAYATIKEINAFMMKGSGFLDVESDLKRYGNLHLDFPIPGTEEKKSLGVLPFDFCFLMDGQDAEDTTLVSLAQYKKQAAQALYEQNIGPMQKNAFSVEDNIIKEMSNPGNYGRNRFGAIGASTVRYPYEEIADFVAYSWVADSIGGEGEAAKWCRYDKEFALKQKEGCKKGLPQTEMPKLSEVYVNQMDTMKDNFTKDIRSKYLSDGKQRVQKYLGALEQEIIRSVNENNEVRNAEAAAHFLKTTIDYKENPERRGCALENLTKLINYENAVRKHTKKVAEGIAESIFYNETKTVNAKEPYTLEALMKNVYNEICHPNAMRYMLYSVESAMDKRINENKAVLESAEKTLQRYSDTADLPDVFNAKHTSENEATLRALCESERENPSLGEKMRKHNQIYVKLNEEFPKYYATIKKFSEAQAKLAAYQIGKEYVNSLSKMFEQFYGTFAERTDSISRKQDDLADELVFHKGDSIFNVCSSRELLDELALSTKNQGSEGALLDSEANGTIFDAIRKNVEFAREIQAMEVVEEDRRVDIFNDVLVEYFRNDVRRKCPQLDMNIIEAIAFENRLLSRINMRKQGEAGEKVIDKINEEDKERHIKSVIAMGQRLAAPSIQRMRNVEPREVVLCAYSKSLLDMRNYRVADLMPKGNAVDSVSKYELRFFNALYNLTPDKLNKFAAPQEKETTKRKGGLYHNAYVTYGKDIGPDTTKGAKISCHIDKRWDNISVMPAMDFGYQEREMLRIHQAVIYGLLYEALQLKPMSLATAGKTVYKYQNSDEQMVTLSVSNNTPCDEFYELFDAMYTSPFIVSDVEVIRGIKSYKDKMRHANYLSTEFKKSLDKFCIPQSREGYEVPADEKTSLFEIPVYYFASLPNNKRFNGELSAIVDAIIKTFEDELTQWEPKEDVKFLLCDILQEQYDIMMDNYKRYPSLRNGLEAKDNPVVDAIVRKIRRVVESTPEPADYVSMIEKMKEKLL